MGFNNDCNYNGHTSEIICNDCVRPAGRPSSIEEICRLKGLQIGDKLRQSIHEHDMHTPRK